MGVNVSADLFFGYDLGGIPDDTPAPPWWHEDEPGWQEVLAMRLGWVAFPFPDDYPTSTGQHPFDLAARQHADRRAELFRESSAAYQAWSRSHKEQVELLSRQPVWLGTYGHLAGERGWAVKVNSSARTVWCGESIEVGTLDVDPEWIDQVARFVELMELDVPSGGPGWRVSVSYG